MSQSSTQHHELAAAQGAVPVAIVTVSDTRTPETDQNGSLPARCDR